MTDASAPPRRATDKMVQAAAEVRLRHYSSEYSADHLTWQDFASEAREMLEAALQVHSRRKITPVAGTCGAWTSAREYTGTPGVLTCAKPLSHAGGHRSEEGAQW